MALREGLAQRRRVKRHHERRKAIGQFAIKLASKREAWSPKFKDSGAVYSLIFSSVSR
jgi:hypothetical protein